MLKSLAGRPLGPGLGTSGGRGVGFNSYAKASGFELKVWPLAIC